jgi:hypothetical protein
MLYIQDNIILDKAFVSWWCMERLGLAEAPEEYTVTLIDASADQRTLRANDAIRLTADGYELLEKTKKKEKEEKEASSGEDSVELAPSKSDNEQTVSPQDKPSTSAESSESKVDGGSGALPTTKKSDGWFGW